jgi:hypothetical protein
MTRKHRIPHSMLFPVRLFINSPNGLVAFSTEHARLPLPWGLDREGPVLAYGSYLDALASFLAQHGYQALQMALSQLLERPVSVQEIQSLEIISQKHGAFYHVAQVCAKVSGKISSLAVNSAVRPAQQALLESEFAVLQDLNKSFPRGFIPRAFVLGESPYVADDGSRMMLRLFIAEWFEGYHEFHLSRRAPADTAIIRVWDEDGEKPFLNDRETRSLYQQAAAILTAYLDPESFSQIYPWHHAAGDFVLKRQQQGVEVRLITVRGYQPLMSVGDDPSEKWIPLMHFFLNLSIRMRLDRLDGTGDLVWAEPDCLHGVVSGFLETWQQKAEKHSDLPQASELRDVLRSFAPEEWLFLSDLVLADGLMEAEELEFLQPRLEEHMTSLWGVLRQ